VSEYPAKFPANHSEVAMSAVAEAAALMRRAADPRTFSVKAAIGSACKRINTCLNAMGRKPMHYGRAEDIWRQEARRIEVEEMDAIRAAAQQEEGMANELQELRSRIARLEKLLSASPAGSDSGRLS
jgi:DNA transposition AAA+ family ATPase